MGKIMERHPIDKFIHHYHVTFLMYSYISPSYRKRCDTTATTLHGICCNFNERAYPAAIFLDVSKASDAFWTAGLIYKLNTQLEYRTPVSF
jgi:hypothetical protein